MPFPINEYTKGSLCDISRGSGTYTYVYAKNNGNDTVSVHVVTKNIAQRIWDALFESLTGKSYYTGKNYTLDIRNKGWETIKKELKASEMFNPSEATSAAEVIENNKGWLLTSSKTEIVAKNQEIAKKAPKPNVERVTVKYSPGDLENLQAAESMRILKKYGCKIEKMKNKIVDTPFGPKKEHGWEYYIHLPKGWTIPKDYLRSHQYVVRDEKGFPRFTMQHYGFVDELSKEEANEILKAEKQKPGKLEAI